MNPQRPSIPRPRLPGYGWVIVVVAALAMLATLPGRTHGLGMITERLLADPSLQLTQTRYGTINLWATLAGALFCLPCGWLIDRYGLRVCLVTTIGALAATVLWMSHIHDGRSFAVAILLTRGFGQSALSVISITMVGKWFPDRLSLPMAVYTLLISFSFAGAFQAAKPWADADWRVLWNGMGYSLLAFLPIALLLTCNPRKSEASDAGPDVLITPAPPLTGFTLTQAATTSTFWVFGIAISLIALTGSGISLFNESVLTNQGFSKETYYNLGTFTGLVGMALQLPVGWLGQRVPLNRLLTVGLGLLALSLALLPSIHSEFGITLYGIGMGVSGTITTVLFFTIWGQAYGQAHLGKIQSVAQMMTVLASAVGPRVFAECFTRFGKYDLIFQVIAGVAAVLAGWSWFVRVPRPVDAPGAAPLASVSPALSEA